MAKNNSPRTPRGNDGGDDKERLLHSKKEGKNNQKKDASPSLPPVPAKAQWFRCLNPACIKEGNGYPLEWSVPLEQAKNVDWCSGCCSSFYIVKIATDEVGRYEADGQNEDCHA